MTRYLVAIHHPDGYDPAVSEDEQMHRDIDALNDEMEAADAIVFLGGLEPIGRSWSLKEKQGGGVIVMDGPYLETKEHIGGFWILEAASDKAALAWARKATVACRAPVEMRPFGRSGDRIELDRQRAQG